MLDENPAGRRSTPPQLFALFEAPYGMNSAVATLFVPMYLLRASGVGIEQASAIASLCLVPATFYFLYAPLTDFFMRRRNWLVLAIVASALLSGAAIASTAGSHVRFVTAILFSSVVASMLISAATGGLMSTLLTHAQKAHVGAWVQVGNLGANGLFFALLLFLEPRCSRMELAIATAVLMLLPASAALWIHEPPRQRSAETYGATIRGIGVELRSTFFSLRNLPGILLLVSPIGTGAVTTVLSGLTREYHASADQLGFANGWGGGVITALGALCVLLTPRSWNRMLTYALAAIVYGAVSLAIAFSPLRASTLIVGLLASNFVQGIAYAAYTGVILQTMGSIGRVQSSRYTILNSIGNIPVVYMTALEGIAAGRFGTRSVGVFDGVLNILTAALFFLWWAWMKSRGSQWLAAPEGTPMEA
jgi:PAT family beta-lactamase induction signal transducer AmpG